MCLQSKSASSTDSQPAEERQGPSGGYSSSQGGAEAKRRRCEDKEPLAPHSYVRVPVSLALQNEMSRAQGDVCQEDVAETHRGHK